MSTTMIGLLDALRTHLREFEVPEPSSVNVITGWGGRNVRVQLACAHLPGIAEGLLAWADTLTQVTAEAWRTPEGDCVHLSVTGQLSGGIPVHVYGGLAFTGHGIGATLAPNASTSVPLTVLRHWATPGKVIL